MAASESFISFEAALIVSIGSPSGINSASTKYVTSDSSYCATASAIIVIETVALALWIKIYNNGFQSKDSPKSATGKVLSRFWKAVRCGKPNVAMECRWSSKAGICLVSR